MTRIFTGILLYVFDLSFQNRLLLAGKIQIFDNMNNVSEAPVRLIISFHELESKDQGLTFVFVYVSKELYSLFISVLH